MRKIIAFLVIIGLAGAGYYSYHMRHVSEVNVSDAKLIVVESAVLAPFSGIVTDIYASVGQSIKQGDAVVSFSTKEVENNLWAVKTKLAGLVRQIPAEHLPFINSKSLNAYFQEIKEREERLQILVQNLSVEVGKAELAMSMAGPSAPERAEAVAQRDAAVLLYRQTKEELEQISNQRSYLSSLIKEAGSDAHLAGEDLGKRLAQYEKLMKDLEALNKQVVESIARSPIDGVVSSVMVKIGDHVTTGQHLGFISSGDDKAVVVGMVPAVMAKNVLSGDTCSVDLADGQTITGRVTNVGYEAILKAQNVSQRNIFDMSNPTLSNEEAVRDAIKPQESQGDLVPVEVEVFMRNPAGGPVMPVTRATVKVNTKM